MQDVPHVEKALQAAPLEAFGGGGSSCGQHGHLAEQCCRGRHCCKAPVAGHGSHTCEALAWSCRHCSGDRGGESGCPAAGRAPVMYLSWPSSLATTRGPLGSACCMHALVQPSSQRGRIPLPRLPPESSRVTQSITPLAERIPSHQRGRATPAPGHSALLHHRGPGAAGEPVEHERAGSGLDKRSTHGGRVSASPSAGTAVATKTAIV